MKVCSLLVLSSLYLAGCAGQSFRVDAGPIFVRARGDVALADSGGSLDVANSVDRDLNLGDVEAAPYLRLRTDIDRHRVQLHGLGVESSGAGILSNDYGDIAAGASVTTSMDFYAIAGNYSYEVLRDERFRVALGGQLGFYSLDVAARALAGAPRESVQTSVLVPMPYVEGEVFFGPVAIGANLGIMSADLGDANGRYWDFEANCRWQIDDRFDVMGGYRYMLLDGFGRASDRDFDADVDVQGLFVTAGVRF